MAKKARIKELPSKKTGTGQTPSARKGFKTAAILGAATGALLVNGKSRPATYLGALGGAKVGQKVASQLKLPKTANKIPRTRPSKGKVKRQPM